MLLLTTAALRWAPPMGATAPFLREIGPISNRRTVTMTAPSATSRPAVALSQSLYPAWEVPLSGKRNLTEVIDAFRHTAVGVPLKASSEPGDGWREWLDGGFASHRFIHAKLSRTTYLQVLDLLLHVMVEVQARYPDLYAVVKFVPKKNGLNPLLASLVEGVDPNSLSIEKLKPREVRRRVDDLRRAMAQTWLMLGCYLTLPGKAERDDFLWASRTVAEKVKTDQRSPALELLCLGFFYRDAALYPLVTAADAFDERVRFSLKAGFERNFGVDVWYPKPTNARMIWQRSRMVYPFLEVAHRAWLNATDMALGQSEPEDCNIIYDDDDEVEAGGESAYVDTFGDLRQALDDYVPLCGDEADEENSAAVCMCMCMCMFHVACGMWNVSCACCMCMCMCMAAMHGPPVRPTRPKE